jgi:parallel beta helix pectate lyase-like protein
VPGVAPDAGVRPEVSLDASAPPGGDGSRERPFHALSEAPAHGRLRLAPGVYPGGVLLEDVELVGGPAVVLTATPPAACIRTRGSVRLEGIQLQGGARGLVVESGRAVLERVRFSGQRGPAIEVAGGAELVLSRSGLQASVSGLPGLRILPDGRAELREVRFQGPFQRAIEATRPAGLRVSGVEVQDAVTGLWLSGGTAAVEGLEVGGGRGPGLYVAGGTLQLREVRVRGHEYGLLTGEGARIDGRGLGSVGAERSGVALVRSKAVLEDVRVESAGQMAAVQLVSSEVRIRGLEVQGGGSSGLSARDAQLTLEGGTIAGVRSAESIEGDAVQIRGGRASVSSLRIQDCSGIGLLAAEAANVTLSRSTIAGAGVAGLSVETLARLLATDVSIERTQGPAVLVTDHGTAQLRGITARGNRDGAVWAECAQGVTVEVDGWTGDVPLAPAPCIRTLSPLTPRR